MPYPWSNNQHKSLVARRKTARRLAPNERSSSGSAPLCLWSLRTGSNSLQKLFRLLLRGRPRILDLPSHQPNRRSRVLEQLKELRNPHKNAAKPSDATKTRSGGGGWQNGREAIRCIYRMIHKRESARQQKNDVRSNRLIKVKGQSW
jgi:hypothetical protein